MAVPTLKPRPTTDLWSGKPEIYIAGDQDTSVAVVFCTGAFNSGLAHLADLLDLFSRIGRLYVVEYSPLNFDTDQTLEAIYEALDTGIHNQVLVIGASLGGKLALQLAEYDATHERRYIDNIKLVVTDAALDYNQLPWPARFSLNWEPGLLTNVLLSWPVTRIMFRTFKDEMLSPGTNKIQLSLHMAAMRRMKMSGMIAQIRAVARRVKFEHITGIPVVYLQCTRDTVIKNAEALAAWRELDVDIVDVISVPSEHVAFVEHYPEWFAAFIEAFERLGIKILDLKLMDPDAAC